MDDDEAWKAARPMPLLCARVGQYFSHSSVDFGSEGTTLCRFSFSESEANCILSVAPENAWATCLMGEFWREF